MLKKIVKLSKEFATKLILELSIETLKKLGIEEHLAEELLEEGLFEEEQNELIDFPVSDEELQSESECKEDNEDSGDSSYIITKNYDMLPVPGAKDGVFALCVQIIELHTGESYWLPYQFIQKKLIKPEPDAID